MNEPEIIKAKGMKLLLNRHIYYRRDSRKGTTYWMCTEPDRCKGTAITYHEGDKIKVRKEGEHTCVPNQERVQAEKVRQNLKRAATEQLEATPAQILRTQLPRVPSGVKSQLPDR